MRGHPALLGTMLSCMLSPASPTLGQHWELLWGLGSVGVDVLTSVPLGSVHPCVLPLPTPATSRTLPLLVPVRASPGTSQLVLWCPWLHLPRWSRCRGPPGARRPLSRSCFWHVLPWDLSSPAWERNHPPTLTVG